MRQLICHISLFVYNGAVSNLILLPFAQKLSERKQSKH